jgi:hypothetical protein
LEVKRWRQQSTITAVASNQHEPIVDEHTDANMKLILQKQRRLEIEHSSRLNSTRSNIGSHCIIEAIHRYKHGVLLVRTRTKGGNYDTKAAKCEHATWESEEHITSGVPNKQIRI